MNDKWVHFISLSWRQNEWRSFCYCETIPSWLSLTTYLMKLLSGKSLYSEFSINRSFMLFCIASGQSLTHCYMVVCVCFADSSLLIVLRVIYLIIIVLSLTLTLTSGLQLRYIIVRHQRTLWLLILVFLNVKLRWLNWRPSSRIHFKWIIFTPWCSQSSRIVWEIFHFQSWWIFINAALLRTAAVFRKVASLERSCRSEIWMSLTLCWCTN